MNEARRPRLIDWFTECAFVHRDTSDLDTTFFNLKVLCANYPPMLKLCKVFSRRIRKESIRSFSRLLNGQFHSKSCLLCATYFTKSILFSGFQGIPLKMSNAGCDFRFSMKIVAQKCVTSHPSIDSAHNGPIDNCILKRHQLVAHTILNWSYFSCEWITHVSILRTSIVVCVPCAVAETIN